MGGNRDDRFRQSFYVSSGPFAMCNVYSHHTVGVRRELGPDLGETLSSELML